MASLRNLTDAFGRRQCGLEPFIQDTHPYRTAGLFSGKKEPEEVLHEAILALLLAAGWWRRLSASWRPDRGSAARARDSQWRADSHDRSLKLEIEDAA